MQHQRSNLTRAIQVHKHPGLTGPRSLLISSSRLVGIHRVAPIHEARRYADIYALPSMQTYARVAQHFGVSRARVCQMMNCILSKCNASNGLLKLPTEVVNYIAGLTDPGELRKYTERRLRSAVCSSNFSE